MHRPVLFQELDITDEAALQELFRKVREELQCPGGLLGFLAGVGGRGAGRKGSAPLPWAMEPPGLAEQSCWGNSGWFLTPFAPCSTNSRP